MAPPQHKDFSWWNFIGGRNASIPTRFLYILMLGVCAHFLSQVILGVTGDQIGSLAVTMPGLLLFGGLYLYLYYTGREKTVKIIIFGFACCLLSLSWFANAGTLGATHVFFILTSFAFVAFTPSRYHFWIVGSFMVLYGLLFVGELSHPEWVRPYVSPESHLWDVLLSNFFICIAICLIFSLMMQRLEQQKQELEKKVKEQKVLNEMIEQQYQTQIELNKALDGFVYRSSHDLRSPLTSAMGLIDITKQAKTQEDIHFYLDLQLKSLKKLDTFITDILLYSQNRHKDLVLEDILLQPVIAESLHQIQHQPAFSKVVFRNEIPHDTRIKGDSLRFRIIFNNLISNAYKYFDPNKPDSYLKISCEVEGNSNVIRFEDNGIGIQEAYQPKIFEMFFRATTKAEGTGVGLFIVKEAIEKMGGTIVCKSQFGVGSTFEIRLPLTN